MSQRRINVILAIIFIFGAGIVAKLFFIQVVKDDFYKALVQGQSLYSLGEKIENARGEIFFKGGEPLAINVEWPLISLSPSEIEDRGAAAKDLALALSLDETLILEKLDAGSLYVILKKRLTDEEVGRIKELDLKGVYLQKEAGRYYPQGTLASQLVGFLNAERAGQYGLEEYYDSVLAGGRKSPGEDITLAVDYPVQFMAEKLLKEAKDNLNIEGGDIIVMDPVTGEILAMANYPSFDPNEYSKVTDLDVFKNSATQNIFEPGSIFKPITMAGAIDMGVITPQTTYQDPGVIKIGKWSIYNYLNRTYPGNITMTEVLEKSINTGAVFAEDRLGNENFLRYVEEFGIFEPTGIDLEETYSRNEELKKGYEINFATASFGQGVEVTPIQLVKAFSAIINGGDLIAPRIAAKIGEEETENEVTRENVISDKTTSQLAAMLVSVIENGYGKPARIQGYYMGGKTGTAQVSFAALGIDKTGYSEKTWQSFIGFAPAFNPQFVILVKIDNPQTKTAEFSAVPIFKKMAKYIIDYYQIPPDYEETTE